MQREKSRSQGRSPSSPSGCNAGQGSRDTGFSAGIYPGFCCTMRLRVFLLFPRDVSSSWSFLPTFARILLTYPVYLSNRPQVSIVYKLINHAGVGRTREEFVNHEPQASGLRILQVFYQHPDPGIPSGLSAFSITQLVV